jgi:predicted DNA-binding ribbon-helix-helix protein
LRLPKPVIDRLRAAAADRNVKVSALMREWLEERLTLETVGDEATVPVSALLALVAERGSGKVPRAS